MPTIPHLHKEFFLVKEKLLMQMGLKSSRSVEHSLATYASGFTFKSSLLFTLVVVIGLEHGEVPYSVPDSIFCLCNNFSAI